MSSPIKYSSAIKVPTLILGKSGQSIGKLSGASNAGKDGIVVIVDEKNGFDKDYKNTAILTIKAIKNIKIRFADNADANGYDQLVVAGATNAPSVAEMHHQTSTDKNSEKV